VRVFEGTDIIHVHGAVNPKEDIEVINSELILADMDSVEKRIAKDTKKARSDKDLARAMLVYVKVLEALSKGTLVTDM